MLRRITRPYFLRATGEGRVDAEELTSGGEPTARGGPTGEPVRTADGGDGGDDDGCDGTAADETWLTVELEYPVPAAVCQLLQLGTDVEVLGPPRPSRRSPVPLQLSPRSTPAPAEDSPPARRRAPAGPVRETTLSLPYTRWRRFSTVRTPTHIHAEPTAAIGVPCFVLLMHRRTYTFVGV